MTDELWDELDALLSRLELKLNNLASESFNAGTNERLSQLCDTKEVEQELIALVGKYRYPIWVNAAPPPLKIHAREYLHRTRYP